MSIDQTIPGGRYRAADGSLHDAEGRPLPEPVVEPSAEEPLPETVTIDLEDAPEAAPVKPAAAKRNRK